MLDSLHFIVYTKAILKNESRRTPEMMWKEFEEIAGYEVSADDYHKIIEPMYMALPDVSKADFVKMIDKKRFALKGKNEILKRMRQIAKHLRETCDLYTDWDALNELEKLRAEYQDRFASGWVHIFTETTLPDQRGCSYPSELLVESNWNSSYNERIWLVKD